MRLPLFQVDAFTSVPFAGNPAAVCVLQKDLPDGLMQNVAAEMNLSETAFVRLDGSVYRLRWFTPKVEVDLCGHATLATAHVLLSEGFVTPDTRLEFETRSGRLTACRSGSEWIQLDFPEEAPRQSEPPADVTAGLHSEGIVFAGRNRWDYFFELETEELVRRIQPDFEKLGSATERGVIVTSRSDSPEFDFVSRFFAPAAGINEDPVTGSAHCCLAPYWAMRLGKKSMRAFQASARGGILEVETRDGRVFIRGQAVTVLKGELAV